MLWNSYTRTVHASPVCNLRSSLRHSNAPLGRSRAAHMLSPGSTTTQHHFRKQGLDLLTGFNRCAGSGTIAWALAFHRRQTRPFELSNPSYPSPMQFCITRIHKLTARATAAHDTRA